MTSLAHWCHRRRVAVLTGWIVVLVGLGLAALGMGTAFSDATAMPDSESATAYTLLAQASGPTASAETGTIVWQTDGVPIDDPTVQADASAMLDQIAALPGVTAVVSPYSEAGARQLNPAAGAAFARVTVQAGADVARITEVAQQIDSSTVEVAVGGHAFETLPGASHGTEGVGILAALVVLLLVFRSAWAAFLPIITGVTGVVASLLVVMLGSHVLNLADTSLTMGALIGLGVGIDYALFIVNRHRRALIAGASVRDAVAQALNTSGRAVVFAGVTVIVALLGMVVVNLDVLTGMAQAAALTVFFTVAAALTLLPALLGMLGHRVLSRRQRAVLASASAGQATTSSTSTPRAAHGRSAGLAARWALLVQRAPLRMGALAAAVIVLLAVPVLGMRVGAADASSDPVGSSTREYYDMTSAAFGDGFDATLLLVAQTPDAGAAQAFTDMVAKLSSVEGVAGVAAAPVEAGQQIAIATVVPSTSAQTQATSDLVHSLRDDVIPAAESGTGLQVYVGGATATSIDLSDALMSKLPLYLGLIAVLGFLLLAMAFRSVLVPLVGAVSNLATILVGLGAITAIFQLGWGTGLLGVGSGAPVMYIVPVLIVGVMFGLSMDYQVFLVSRMHEEWISTRDNAGAVRVGVSETGRVIATAATIMLFVFASFGFSGERIVSAIGIGLAIAVLVDAFVVRLTLVPALMTLIGRRNWSYPQWAERLTPRLSVEGSVEGSDEDLDRELASEQPELVLASQGSQGARIRKE